MPASPHAPNLIDVAPEGKPGRVGLAACLVLSLQLHAFAAMIWPEATATSRAYESSPASVGTPAAPSLEVRLASAAPRVDAGAPPLAAVPPHVDPVLAGTSRAAGKHVVATPDQPRDFEEAHYWRASELTKRPAPNDPIVIDTADLPIGLGRAVLEIYVSASGGVDTVALLSSDLARHIEDAALNAFAAAHFTPGERNGRAVGSIFVVEVTAEPDAANLPATEFQFDP